MPDPKDGTAGLIVAPVVPKKPNAADDADPGQVQQTKASQRQNQSGKYGSTEVKPYQPPGTTEEKQTKKSWVEIKLLDDQGNPMAGESFYIDLPDGSRYEGTTDDKGEAHVEGIDAGSCTVHFPQLEDDQWRKH